MIDVRSLYKAYGGVTVLRDIALHVKQGEHVAVIGPSGVGKSVLLRCINGLVTPDRGEIRIGGIPLAGSGAQSLAARRKTGMVFQQFLLFTHLNVIDNIILSPVRIGGVSAREAIEKAESLLQLVGLSDKRNASVGELSGGQQQRVAIARALAMEPDVLLFDEPTSALDPTVARDIMQLILRIADGRTALIVSHEMGFVREISDRVLFVARERIYEEGTPQALLDNPKEELTRAFLSQTDH